MTHTLIDDPSDAPARAAPWVPPPVDFGVVAGDYARHRQGYPHTLFDRLAALGVGRAGQRIVDLGTGTGAVARALAARGARVTGVDPSPALLEKAAELAARDGLDVTWCEATAETTGLGTGQFDAVLVGSAWHWFDRPRAAAEARRLLRSGGRMAIVHLDWVALAGSVVAVTLDLVARHRAAPPPVAPDIGPNGVYPHWPADLSNAGFYALELFGFDLVQRYPHAGWRGRMRASALVSTMPPAAKAAFEADLIRALAMGFPDPTAVPHRVFAVVARAP